MFIISAIDCDARLTVHRAKSQLQCHHCGAIEPLPSRCGRCGFTVKPVGQGTERVQETLQTLLPEHPLVRLAGVIQLTDYASVYLAIASVIDPGQAVAVNDLQARTE